MFNNNTLKYCTNMCTLSHSRNADFAHSRWIIRLIWYLLFKSIRSATVNSSVVNGHVQSLSDNCILFSRTNDCMSVNLNEFVCFVIFSVAVIFLNNISSRMRKFMVVQMIVDYSKMVYFKLIIIKMRWAKFSTYT